jgi:hypothetical protein
MNILRLNDINGVLDARLNILPFEIGVIIPNNGFKRNRFADQFEHRLHGNARPGDTWFPKMNFGADLNSIHATNLHCSPHKRQAGTGLPLFATAATSEGAWQLANQRSSDGNHPTAKQPALASTGKGASLIFQKNHRSQSSEASILHSSLIFLAYLFHANSICFNFIYVILHPRFQPPNQ